MFKVSFSLTVHFLRRRTIQIIVICPVILTSFCIFLTFYQPSPVVKIVSKIVPDVMWFGTTDKPHIALTLDDGPHPVNTPKVMKILDKYDIRATFFVIGKEAEKYPALLEEIRDRGHQIANHFYEDKRVVLRDRTEVEDSLDKTEGLIQQTNRPLYLRPAKGWFGPMLMEIARKKGHILVLGSIYPRDSYGVPAWYIEWAVRSLRRNGSIIILHDGGRDRSNTIAALPKIIESAQARGLQFVTIQEMYQATSFIQD